MRRLLGGQFSFSGHELPGHELPGHVLPGRQGGVAVVVADGRSAPLPSGVADAVVVDAPCSGLGALRRSPELRWRADPAAVPRLQELQRALLDEAVRLVRPGGRVVYSVCTLTTEETTAQDVWLGERYPAMRAVSLPREDWRPAGRGGLRLPHDGPSDGMYALLLEAGGEGGVRGSSPTRS